MNCLSDGGDRMKKPDNPAKNFLRQYVSLKERVDSLQRAIDDAMSRAMNTTITLKEIKVISSPAESDPMARDVCNAIDACEMLYEEKQKAESALRNILQAIDSLSDEQQKTLLTMRYVEGAEFGRISEAMHYEKTQIFVIHGRALVEINKWLIKQSEKCSA